jgi:hypothetical protein
MNRKYIFATALLACTTLASAAASGSIVFENRSDFVMEQWSEVKVDDKTTGLKTAAGKDSTDRSGVRVYGSKVDRPNNFGLSMNRLRTDFKGQFSNDVKYRLRMRWDKTLGANKSFGLVQSLDGAVDNAYVQPKFSDNLTVKIGKFTTEGQGFEQLISSIDIYLFSSINKNYVSGLTSMTGVRPIINLEGIGEFTLTAGNTGFATTSDSLTVNRVVYGAGYLGKFGMFEPLANFSLVPKQDWQEGQIDAGLGLRTTIDKIVSVFDIQSQTTNGDGVVISKGLDKVVSGGMTLQYKGENLRPQAKIFYDRSYLGDTQTNKVLGLSGALEYFPTEDAKYRYHVAVTDLRTTPIVNKVDGTTTSEIKLYVGVAMTMDMWKF